MLDLSDSERLLANAALTIDRRDAEILLAALLAQEPLTTAGRHGRTRCPRRLPRCFAEARRQRASGVPVAYLLGRREFWSLDFTVNAAVLVPRPETELLVQRVLDLVSAPAAAVADLGTGSGAIAIALAHERPHWRVLGTDCLGPGARGGARQRRTPGRRARANGLEGDWYSALAGRRFDALVSNPPYVAGDDPVLVDDGLRHEPRAALTPGGDGFAALATLINGAPGHLRPGGWLALEHGTTQGERLRSMLVARGFTHVTSHRDLAGHERVTEGNLAP